MTQFHHCETCRFWGDPAKDDPKGEFRTCTAVVHDERELTDSEYDDVADEDDLIPKRAFRAAHKAVVQDGSGYRAALLPRRDFGCVLHETKDDVR